uniref:Uncharacterized protein n=1 Tax=Anopheles atroparvus TaxID=41427 RepID=A0AAG5D7D2_ANOAO
MKYTVYHTVNLNKSECCCTYILPRPTTSFDDFHQLLTNICGNYFSIKSDHGHSN